MSKTDKLAKWCLAVVLLAACSSGSEAPGQPDPSVDASDDALGDATDDDTSGCTPKTCALAGAVCGSLDDGCGNTLQCGTCADGLKCGIPSANKCGGGCKPASCSTNPKNCGTISDGCGGSLNCGGCTAPQTCGGGGQLAICGCTPTTCAAAGKNCGTIANGCGGTLSCGGCANGETCGGGGSANVCGKAPCVPKTCAQLGKNCGSVSDGCSTMLECGTCTDPNTCGANVPNVCGCKPKTCGDLGANCGTPPDGCSSTLFCGSSCGLFSYNTCGGGGEPFKCGCTPKQCDPGDQCGSVPSGCGSTTTSCGTCGTGTACNTATRRCECVPKTCAGEGQLCGSLDDGCGTTLQCSGCTGKCTANVCTPYSVSQSAVCTPQGWCFRHPLPQPYRINDAWALSSTDVYAVGDTGTIIHYDGTKWTGVAGFRNSNFRAVWGAVANDIWVVGTNGAVLRGNTTAGWTDVTVPGVTSNMTLTDVRGSSASSVYFVGWDGTPLFVKFTGTFAPVTPPPAIGVPNAVFETGASSLWFSGSGGTFYWDGMAWTKEDPASMRMWGTGSEMFGVGSGGFRRRIGTTWAGIATPKPATLNRVVGLSATNVFAVGHEQFGTSDWRAAVLQWNGSSCTSIRSDPSSPFYAVAAAPGLDVLAFADFDDTGRGRIDRLFGTTWTTQSSSAAPLNASLSRMTGASATDLWTGTSGALYHWFGGSWTSRAVSSLSAVWPLGAGDALYAHNSSSGSPGVHRLSATTSTLESGGTHYAIWGSSANDIWATGTALTKRRINGTWSTVTNPLVGTTVKLLAISGTAANDVWAVGDNAYILHWNDVSWSVVSAPPGITSAITGVWASTPTDAWAISGSNILHYDGTWSVFQTLTGVTLTSISGSGTDVLVTGSDKLYRRNGSSFTVVDVGVPFQARAVHVDGTAKKVFASGWAGLVMESPL